MLVGGNYCFEFHRRSEYFSCFFVVDNHNDDDDVVADDDDGDVGDVDDEIERRIEISLQLGGGKKRSEEARTRSSGLRLAGLNEFRCRCSGRRS